MPGRRAKPVNIISKNLTNEEIRIRKENEEKLKGSDNKVYRPPKGMIDEEKKTYKFLVNELNSSKILSNLDITLLEQTVECIVKLHEIKKAMSGLNIKSQRGYVAMYKEYFNMYIKCSAELGLSPASRAKIANANITDGKKKSDPLLKVLNK